MKRQPRKMTQGGGFIFPLIGMLLAASCNFLSPAGLKTITPAELHQLLKSDDIFLVDVHIPEQRHIQGTDLFIPYTEVGANLHKFPVDKQTPIYLYCEGGPMARSAARPLIKAGYQNVYNLEGGIIEWLKAGYPLEP